MDLPVHSCTPTDFQILLHNPQHHQQLFYSGLHLFPYSLTTKHGLTKAFALFRKIDQHFPQFSYPVRAEINDKIISVAKQRNKYITYFFKDLEEFEGCG